jgi:hypothetical protein
VLAEKRSTKRATRLARIAPENKGLRDEEGQTNVLNIYFSVFSQQGIQFFEGLLYARASISYSGLEV